jgi:hypothetical protein
MTSRNTEGKHIAVERGGYWYGGRFRQGFALDDEIAIDSHAWSLEAIMNSVTLLNGLKALEDAIDSPAYSLEAIMNSVTHC